MDLMEYKAKELFDKYEIPTQKGIVIEDVSDLASKALNLTFPLVAKATGTNRRKRKAGGIKFASNTDELLEVSKSILGMDIKGHIVKKLLIVES